MEFPGMLKRFCEEWLVGVTGAEFDQRSAKIEPCFEPGDKQGFFPLKFEFFTWYFGLVKAFSRFYPACLQTLHKLPLHFKNAPPVPYSAWCPLT